MALKIGFLTSLGVNVGDEFIREGIRAMLDATGAPYTPLYIHKESEASLYEPAEDEAVTARDKYWESDLFIQGGAPVYWHLRDGLSTSLNSEWHLWMWERRILAGKAGAEAEFDTMQAGDDGRRHPVFANLGAGSCSPWGGTGAAFLADASCADFARRAGRRAQLTTVRDPVAGEILTKLDVAHVALPCPAFLAAARHRLDFAPTGGCIGVNLMPLGGHWDLNSDFDPASWHLDCLQLTALLRRLGSLVFIAHDATERDWLQRFTTTGERVFFSSAWRDYLDLYSSCALVVANRVHGAVCAAGFGVPGVILGNDTRAQIGCALDLPIFQSGRVDPREAAAVAGRLLTERKSRAAHFHSLRETTLQSYRDLLRPLLEQARERQPRGAHSPSRRQVAPAVALGSVAELESPAFRGWMETLNAFAERHELRVFTNWSKIWEYPWLWRHALGRLDWRGRRLVDLGSETSPLPWFLATLGARVTLIEVDPQWVPRWEKLRAELSLDIDWHIVSDERLPLPDESVDAVTTFSVVEHQADKAAAIDEIARVLRPGGLLAISFDICEPEMGMTFPEWNGRALTRREFEDLVWKHPAFASGRSPEWDLAVIPDFLRWHLLSAPHHNYIVGAAILNRRRPAP